MNSPEEKANISLALGILSIFTWILPVFGYPVSIVGLVMGISGIKSDEKPFGIAGLILSIIGLTFCIANSAIGAYKEVSKLFI